MLGTQTPSLNKLVTTRKNSSQLSRPKSTIIAASAQTTKRTEEYLNKKLSKSSDLPQSSSIHQFYAFYRLKHNSVVLSMPKVYQLNFDENFVNEKELINRNDGVTSRRGTLLLLINFN